MSGQAMKLTGAHVDKENEAAHDCCKFDLRKPTSGSCEVNETNTTSGRSHICMCVSAVGEDVNWRDSLQEIALRVR